MYAQAKLGWQKSFCSAVQDEEEDYRKQTGTGANIGAAQSGKQVIPLHTYITT